LVVTLIVIAVLRIVGLATDAWTGLLFVLLSGSLHLGGLELAEQVGGELRVV
jgi:hypothetical protein